MKKKITLEDLAGMVKSGFTEVEKKMEQMRTELRTETQNGFHAVNRRLDLLHEDISDLPDIREELKDHDERLVRVEHKVGAK